MQRVSCTTASRQTMNRAEGTEPAQRAERRQTVYAEPVRRTNKESGAFLLLKSTDLHSELCNQVVLRVRAESGGVRDRNSTVDHRHGLGEGRSAKVGKDALETRISFAARQCSTARKAGPRKQFVIKTCPELLMLVTQSRFVLKPCRTRSKRTTQESPNLRYELFPPRHFFIDRIDKAALVEFRHQTRINDVLDGHVRNLGIEFR